MTNQLLAELEMANKKLEEKDKAIIGLNNTIIELHSVICRQQAKINRLNNILNELESYLEQQWLEWKDSYNEEIVAMANEDKAILDKLKELKEGK